MNKKILIIVLSLVCVIACALGLAACDNPNSDNPPEPPKSITITFETNGGTAIDPVTTDIVKTLEKLIEGKVTEKADKVFVGWYLDASLNEDSKASMYAFIEEDITLYAAWRDYTDAELLEIAVNNTRKDAIAAHDSGMVRLNITSFGYGIPDVILALDNGVITAGSRESSNKYYKDETFYYTSNQENIKLKQKTDNTATEFLYLNTVGTVDYKTHGFYSTFAPISMFRLAETSLCSFERDGDTFTVTYIGSQSAIGHNWQQENNPYVYFDAGKIFKFTVADNRVVKVEQLQTTVAKRTIEFFFDGDENIPAVAQPQDESVYAQKWQVMVDGRILLLTELNKEELDVKVYGSDCEQLTKNQTYYLDEAMQQAVDFGEGTVTLSEHLNLYHPRVSLDDLVVIGFEIAPSKYETGLTLQGTSQEDGVKTTTFVRTDASAIGSVELRVTPTPHSAFENDFTVELIDKQSGEELSVQSYTRSKSINIPKNIEREIVIKITAVKGGYTEYIRIKPMPQDN